MRCRNQGLAFPGRSIWSAGLVGAVPLATSNENPAGRQCQAGLHAPNIRKQKELLGPGPSTRARGDLFPGVACGSSQHMLAKATPYEAVKRWPEETIRLCAGAVRDGRTTSLAVIIATILRTQASNLPSTATCKQAVVTSSLDCTARENPGWQQPALR
jgi:hypothetical protein